MVGNFKQDVSSLFPYFATFVFPFIYSKFLNGWHISSAVNMTCRHVTFTWLGVSPRLSLAQRKSNVVATQRTSYFSNAGREAHPIKKEAITIDTSCSHTYTSCSCSEKVPTNMKIAVASFWNRILFCGPTFWWGEMNLIGQFGLVSSPEYSKPAVKLNIVDQHHCFCPELLCSCLTRLKLTICSINNVWQFDRSLRKFTHQLAGT